MKIIIYLFFSTPVLIAATCQKRIDCSQNIYSFEGNYKIVPDADSIHLGDTIWLESTITSQLTDKISNQVIDYSGAENLGMAVSYLELTGGSFSNPGSIPAASNFENILKKGSEGQSPSPQQTRVFRYAEEGNTYLFLLGIVAKKKGLFLIGPGDAANVYTSKNRCDKASFSLTFANTNQHLYLYEQSRPGYTPPEYEKSHGYFFKVY